MISQIFFQYEKGKPSLLKLIALCIKAVTGVVGASMILTEQNPYLSVAVLCLGAIVNELLNFINSGSKSQKLKLIALCIKGVTGVLGASMILTEQRPYFTVIILSIGAIANEILNFTTVQETPDPINPPQP